MRPALLCLLLCACGDEPRPGPLRHPDRMSVWAEELPLADLDRAVRFAREHRLNLNASVRKDTHDRAYVEALCRAAAREDVALRLWPGLARASGYWPGQANVDEFLAWSDELLALRGSSCPRLDGLVVDMEMPIGRVDELAAMRAAGRGNLEIAGWFLEHTDEARFEDARAKYAAWVRRARGEGLFVWVTTLPMNADDYDDGDETIAKALWTPIEGIEWDLVSFQVYRNLFDQQFPPAGGGAYTSGLVTSYARSATAEWGARAAVDLGTTGGGIGLTTGLASAAELQADIAAALAAGLDPGRVALFSLEGVLEKPDGPAWVALPAPRAAEPTTADEDAREVFRTLDALGR